MAGGLLSMASLLLASGLGAPDADAVARLRAAGPPGLDSFLATHAEALARCREGDGEGCEPLLAALDRLAGQRGALHSRLYWYTDMDAATAAARLSGRPILSLHLLGRLDEDWSCANSRFFRTVLYADDEISRVLRERFVLHWASVRPAPRVTVDFGDGRRLERTLTGNSVHYVLSPDGRPIDALPGLYAPRAFLATLAEAEAAALAWARGPEPQRERRLRAYHRRRQRGLEGELGRELLALGLTGTGASAQPAPGPRVVRADRLAVTKSAVENPILRDVVGREAGEPPDAATWRALGLRRLESARLSGSARRIVAREAPDSAGAVRRLEERIAEDTARNELGLHARLHGWFAEGSAPSKLAALNGRVYRELFLASDDPWAGLAPDDLFVGLPDGGRVVGR
jgi:hypothetical protein